MIEKQNDRKDPNFYSCTNSFFVTFHRHLISNDRKYYSLSIWPVKPSFTIVGYSNKINPANNKQFTVRFFNINFIYHFIILFYLHLIKC